MASSDQPLKKRRLYELPPESPPRTSPPPPPPNSSHDGSAAAPQSPEPACLPPASPQTPSRDEIATKRKNREEIRLVYESYKKLRFCVSQKEAHPMPELEEAYLSLITASQGCTSVQCIVAELIPRYASYCPSALEAAATAIVNMHNWNLAIIKRGEDADGIAFQTAKTCIFGLVDICCTASLEAPTSSVTQGIRSAVFLNVLTFFVSSFGGRNIFEIVDKEWTKLPDTDENFSYLKLKLSNEDESPVTKLSKFQAITILRIFFACPKSMLAACFELLNSSIAEGLQNDGQYFLSQVTRRLDGGVLACILHHSNDKAQPCIISSTNKEKNGQQQSDCSHISVSTTCLLQLAIDRDHSLRSWIIKRYNRLKKFSPSGCVPEILSMLKGCMESFIEGINWDDSQVQIDEDASNPSVSSNQHNWTPGMSSHHGKPSGKEDDRKQHDRLRNEGFTGNSGQYSNSYSSGDLCSKIGPDCNGGGPRPMDFEPSERGDIAGSRPSMCRDGVNHQSHSPVPKQSDFRSNSFDGRNRFVHGDRNHIPHTDAGIPLRSTTGTLNNSVASPRHNYAVRYSSPNQVFWLSDGDPAAMDIVSASRQLWLGYLAPDVSETHVRYQLDRFGPIDHFFFYQRRGFALVEFRSIMDSIRARDYIRRHFPWRIKFLDIGLGTMGAVNGIAVGYSSFIYVGNISSQWMRDEFLNESRKAIYKGPNMVTDLTNEGALLLEYETSEEAATVMTHLRQYRKEMSNRSHMDPSRSAAITAHGVGSPHPQMVAHSPADSTRTRMSQLSSLFSSLRLKYNISQTFSYFDNHNDKATNSRGEEMTSSTLWIYVPNSNTPYLLEDELMTICRLAIGDVGSIIRLTRTNMQSGSGWLVECSSVDAAVIALRNLRGCPGTFLQIELSHGGQQPVPTVSSNPDGGSSCLVSPRLKSDSTPAPGPHTFQTNWTSCSSENIVVENTSQGSSIVSGASSAPASISCMQMAPQGPNLPHHQIQPSTYMQPTYFAPSNPWDPRGSGHHLPGNPVHPGPVPNNFQVATVSEAPLPPPVTPVAQLPGSSINPEHTLIPPEVPPPPLPPSPPPPPQAQPPSLPPPPCSPPPPPPPLPASEPSYPETSSPPLQYQWQGTLCKSGVHYCIIHAYRVDSNICKYSTGLSEPADWPVKLDMTKRTDFRHVKSAFNSTPPHRREVCRMVPASAADRKGFGDFISYLKQRECAGVIKIPAMSSIWARLLFMLPYSEEVCSMLSIPHLPSDALIALVMPKETHIDGV